MRIYLPATLAELADPVGLDARAAHAVTQALRRAIGDEDEETAEFAALLLAADSSVARIAATGAVPRRVVVAADVPEGQVHVGTGAGPDADAGAAPSAVRAPAVAWDAVVSFHVDAADDAEAREVLVAAVGGDEDALERSGEIDLLWYDVSEREDLAAGR